MTEARSTTQRRAQDAASCDGRTWVDFTDRDTFTVTEVAAAEGCHPRTIRRLLRDPRKPFGDSVYKLGRFYRIPRDAVAHFHAWARVAA